LFQIVHSSENTLVDPFTCEMSEQWAEALLYALFANESKQQSNFAANLYFLRNFATRSLRVSNDIIASGNLLEW
jgi:hypothetical protein